MTGGGKRFTVDLSGTGAVVVCRDCPHWYGVADDRVSGWREAAAHEQRAHTTDQVARSYYGSIVKESQDREKMGA